MVESANILIPMEILWGSNMLGTLIGSYVFLHVVIFVSFVNIFSVDKYEFLNNMQNCIKLKHKLFFVVIYSKEKHIVSKKTLILELVGYLISITSIVVLICSLKQNVTTAIILLGIVTLLVFTFGCITGFLYRKTKKYR